MQVRRRPALLRRRPVLYNYVLTYCTVYTINEPGGNLEHCRHPLSPQEKGLLLEATCRTDAEPACRSSPLSWLRVAPSSPSRNGRRRRPDERRRRTARGGGALSASDPTSLLDRSSFKEELRLWALRLPSTACEAALKALRKGASNLAFTRPKLRTIIPDPAASHGAEGGAVTRLLLLDDVLFPRPAAGGAPPGTRGRAGDDDDRDDVPLF